VTPLGDWTTQAKDPGLLFQALGTEGVMRKAAAGVGEAQFSLGIALTNEATGGGDVFLGARGTSPKTDVGLEFCTYAYSCTFPVVHNTKVLVDVVTVVGHVMTKIFIGVCQPWSEEGMALLEKAAGQGHAYAMQQLALIHNARKEHERAREWFTKGAETGLPIAMFSYAVCLDQGEGLAAPDYPAAADWYRRAADAGVAEAANNLGAMYAVGRGKGGH
jgi:TPR repeat protein